MVLAKSASEAQRWLGLLCLGFVLAGCASSIDSLNSEAGSAQSIVDDPMEEQPERPLPKDAKILEPGSRVNDYVNDSLPSQFAHTLQELNKAPADDQYPAIEDIPPSELQLLTLEERRKLEEELSRLGGS